MSQNFYNNRFVLDDDVRFDGDKLMQSTAATTFYVETTGNDTTGDGSVSNPFKTITKALNSVGEFLTGNLKIYLGTGTFAGCTISKELQGTGYILIQGTPTVIVAETTATSGTTNTITVAGAGWGVNDYAGKFVRLTAGTNYLSDATNSYINNVYPIISNTADTLTVPEKAVVYDSTTKFEIVEQGTLIESSGYALANYSNPRLSIYPKYLELKSTGSGYYAIYSNNGNMQPRGCKITRGSTSQYGIYHNDGYCFPQGCYFDGTFTAAVYIRGGSNIHGVQTCYIKDAATGVYISEPNAAVYLSSLSIEGATTGVNCLYGAQVNMITWNQYVYIDNCTTALKASYGGEINANYVNTRSAINTTGAEVTKGGLIRTNNSLSATNPYSLTDAGSLIFNDDTSLELSLSELKYSDELTNGSYIDLISGTSGIGEVLVGDSEEYAYFVWASDGTVSLIDYSSNVVDTDTNTKFCIFDNGDNVRVRNRLGSTKDVSIRATISRI